MSEVPAYVRLHRSGALSRLADRARQLLTECRICPHECGANRLGGETGQCGVGELARVASYGPHFGEEAPLVGRGGSGTVFFSGCNLACVFCQNHDISQKAIGTAADDRSLASIFLGIESIGCHNLNLVTPSHVMPQILGALALAADQGFRLPIVWNSGGYDSASSLELLDGVVDIYLPDAKYSDPNVADRLSGCADYPEANQAALIEMHRQVGDLQVDSHGIARRGLMIRHLVLPGGLAGTAELASFVVRELSTRTYVHVMGGYHPCYMARSYPELSRRPTVAELRQAREQLTRAGLSTLDRTS